MTPKMTPNKVKNDLSLCALSDDSAIFIPSKNLILFSRYRTIAGAFNGLSVEQFFEQIRRIQTEGKFENYLQPCDYTFVITRNLMDIPAKPEGMNDFCPDSVANIVLGQSAV